jgi:hypothetical protein
VSKTVTRLADGTYSVTFTAVPDGTGAATVTIRAKDSAGRTNTTIVRLTVTG